MAHAVEGRPPFLDDSVRELAWSAAPRLRARPGAEKPILRAALQGILPEAERTRPKRPFLGPPVFTTGDPQAEALLLDTLHDARASCPFVDAGCADRVRAALQRAAAGGESRTWEAPIFLLLTLALLRRKATAQAA